MNHKEVKEGRTGADGSVGYERSIRNRKIAGSNPAQSIDNDWEGFGRF